MTGGAAYLIGLTMTTAAVGGVLVLLWSHSSRQIDRTYKAIREEWDRCDAEALAHARGRGRPAGGG